MSKSRPTAPAAPPIDHFANIRKIKEELEAYKRLRPEGTGPTLIEAVIDPEEKGGIVDKLAALREAKVAEDWETLQTGGALNESEWKALSTFARGQESQTFHDKFKQIVVDNIKTLKNDDPKEIKDKTKIAEDLKAPRDELLGMLSTIQQKGGDDKVKEAAKRLHAKYSAELDKLQGQYYDAEIERIDVSLGRQKSTLLSLIAAERANQLQEWPRLGWFATPEFASRPLDEKKREGELSVGTVTLDTSSFEAFRKSEATRYMSVMSKYYMEISDIKKDDNGYVTSCSVRSRLKPNEKEGDVNIAKAEALSFLAEKTGCDMFTINFDDNLKPEDYVGHKVRMKEIEAWVKQAKLRKPPMRVKLGNGCQDAIDFSKGKDPGMHALVNNLLATNAWESDQYQKQEKQVSEERKGYLTKKQALIGQSDNLLGQLRALPVSEVPTVKASTADREEAELKAILSEITRIQGIQNTWKNGAAGGSPGENFEWLLQQAPSQEENLHARTSFYEPELNKLLEIQRRLDERVDVLDRRFQKLDQDTSRGIRTSRRLEAGDALRGIQALRDEQQNVQQKLDQLQAAAGPLLKKREKELQDEQQKREKAQQLAEKQTPRPGP